MFEKIKAKTKQVWNWVCEKARRFKKWIAVVVLGAGTVLAMGAALEPEEIATQQDIIDKIEVAQDAYFIANGIYWQGLSTHTSVPTTTTTPDNINKKPYYQTEKWADLVVLPAAMPYSVEVHQYKTPDGKHGYQIIIRDKTFTESYGYGPEAASRTYKFENKILDYKTK